jgi:hypothetical protein
MISLISIPFSSAIQDLDRFCLLERHGLQRLDSDGNRRPHKSTSAFHLQRLTIGILHTSAAAVNAKSQLVDRESLVFVQEPCLENACLGAFALLKR